MSLSIAQRTSDAVDDLAWRAGVRAGCDVVDIAHFRARLLRRPALLERLFTPGEIAAARRGGAAAGGIVEARRLAARVAAKEATYKALGRTGLRFRDVEVVTAADGAPHLLLRGQRVPAALSLSHDGGVAMAVVIATPDAAVPNPIDLQSY